MTRESRITELRRMLLARRHDLEADIRGALSSVRAERVAADHAGPRDEIEVADQDVQQDIELVLVQMRRETLTRIDAALDRLHEGRYGRCAECGREIPALRLRAMPFAVRCLDCEDAREASRRPVSERGSGISLDSAPGLE